jgi:hypothetical protein
VSDRRLADSIAAAVGQQARRRRAPSWICDVLDGASGEVTIREQDDVGVRVTREDGEWFEIRLQLVLPTPLAEGRGPWSPDGLELKDEELFRLSYIVVDEIVGDVADVSVSPWPRLDARGRLFMGDDPAVSVRASRAALDNYLKRADFRSADDSVGPRPVRMGDVFAARVRHSKLAAAESSAVVGAPPLRPSAWIVPPIYDVRARARDKAREAFYAAVTPTVGAKEMRALQKVKLRPPRSR